MIVKVDKIEIQRLMHGQVITFDISFEKVGCAKKFQSFEKS